jgi:hypothetical protein
MEPVSLTTAAIATLVATKAFEKTGEKLTDSVWNLVSGFLTALRKKDPKTAEAIEQVAQQPALAEQQPATHGTAALVKTVETLAAQDPELQTAAQVIQTAVQAQPGAIVNMTQLAEKIGVVNQGTIVNQQNTINL